MSLRELPDKQSIIRALQTKLVGFEKTDINWKKVAENAKGRSYADITRACEEAAKEMVLNDRRVITTEDLMIAFSERSSLV